MGFLEDAQNFMKNKQSNAIFETWDPLNPQTRNQLFDECRRLYENATKQEIERAIDRALDELESPYNKEQFMKKLRTRLED